MPEPTRFLSALLAQPPAAERKLARYTVWNGVLYLVIGLTMAVSPAGLLSMINGRPIEDQGMVRLLGVLVGVIGWFYVMGGRTGATSFGLATVVDRAAIPLLLGALVLTDQVSLQLVGPFAVLDPLLALGAFLLWRSERSAEDAR